MNDDIQILLEYIAALEGILKDTNPTALQQSEIAQKRDRLLPLLQKQREVILVLQRKSAESESQNATLESRIAQLESRLSNPRSRRKP